MGKWHISNQGGEKCVVCVCVTECVCDEAKAAWWAQMLELVAYINYYYLLIVVLWMFILSFMP